MRKLFKRFKICFRRVLQYLSEYLKACADPRRHVPNADDETLNQYIKERDRYRRNGMV